MSLSTLAYQIVSGLVVLLLLIDKFWNGATKIRKEVGDAYKERAEQLEKGFKELNEKFILQGNDLAALRATVIAKDEHIANLNQTIQNRNPELERILAKIGEFLEKLSTETTKQTTMLNQSKERDKKIDESTEKEQGHILRKK